MYVQTKTGKILEEGDLRARYFISLGNDKITEEWLKEHGFAEIQEQEFNLKDGQTVSLRSTASEIDGEWYRDYTIIDAPQELTYAQLRSNEYPALGDQLDAIWKELNARRLNGDNLVSDADEMLGKILAVKNKYPKE